MARVDPEALEREAEELMVQHGLIPDPKASETPVEPEPSPAPQADTDDETKPPVTDDELDRGDPEKSVDDETEVSVLRERYKNAQAAMTRANQRAADAERQVADLRREIADLRANPPAQQDAPQSAAEADEAVRKALDEYPEIVGPLLKKLEQVETEARTTKDALTEREREAATDAHMRAIRDKHKDVDDIIAQPEFTGWVSRQTPYWRHVAEQGTVEQVVELLDRYKEATGVTSEPEPQRESALDRARKVAEPELPKGRKPDPNANKRIWSRKEIGAMPLDEYEKHRDEIDRAYVEGRVR